MGGAALSWRQLFFPMKMAELPDQYCLLWLSAPMLMGAFCYRWYLGMEWFGIVRLNRLCIATIACLAPAAIYLFWLWQNYLKIKDARPQDRSANPQSNDRL